MKKIKVMFIVFSILLMVFFSVETASAYTSTEETLPSYYSSKDLGYCTPVKTQKQSICWAYASISTFESYLLKNNLFEYDLSTSHLDLWATADDNGNGWLRKSGQASYVYAPLGYLTSWQGPVNNENNSINIGATQIKYLDKNKPEEIKKAIIDNGAVYSSYNSVSACESSDNTSYALTQEYPYNYGHSISVVGWDDNYSKDNFNGLYTPQNNGAWLCKNSWGENYNSIGGYIWISYEDYYLFNEEVYGPSYTIEGCQTINSKDYLYQNEIFGATYEFEYLIKDTITYFNVFDFSQHGNTLDKVVFESKSIGADFQIHYVPLDEYGTPDSDTTKWMLLDKGTINYKGYICSDFDDLTISQTKGAIGITIDTSTINNGLNYKDSDYIFNGIGVCEWLSDTSGNMLFTQQGEYGESFITYDNKINDVMTFYKDYNQDLVGGTFVIKAITNNIVNTKTNGDIDLNGTVNICDATKIQMYLVGLTPHLLNDQHTNADFNNDGEINITDVTAIQKYLAKIQD